LQSVCLGEKHIGRQFESGAQSARLGKVNFHPSGEKHRNRALASKFGDQIPLVQALIREGLTANMMNWTAMFTMLRVEELRPELEIDQFHSALPLVYWPLDKSFHISFHKGNSITVSI
jgi:hypothetical protein